MTRSIVIAAVQANPTVGAIAANEAQARLRLAEARAAGADLAVFPELFINGYPPEDLALKPAFWRAGQAAVERLALETDDTFAALVGVIWPAEGPGRRPRNGLAFLAGGRVQGVAFKSDLPNYGVFDEKRVFEPGEGPSVFTWKGVRLGVPICEDIWSSGVCAALAAQGAEILVAPNGSPYRRTADRERTGVARARVAETGLPLIYLNEVGGQDELVFDGASFALDARGREVMRLPMFEEAVGVMRWSEGPEGWTATGAPLAGWMDGPGEVYHAMVVGLRDYVNKSGFPGVLLGLSGGVDSAITAVVAADALGPDRVRCFMLPSRYTSRESLEDAEDCARRLGVRLDEIPISPAVDAFAGMLTPLFENRPPDLTEENIQARIRGLSLMALSNKLGSMLLTTGNKSEIAVGYATLYGDMCGGYNVLKDLYKTEVYEVCRWRNAHDPFGVAADPIPDRILTKPPSAELRPDQKDQDSLPEYADLDAILHGLVEEEASLDEIVDRGFPREMVERVQRLLYGSEYKRRQAAPGVKIGPKAFGRDRRYPIVNGFRDQVSKG
ncbi:NAD+ synthase [Phenylobacterium parvum]|jgi:NAD+ synthase|uniref:Glutamine-dependent NAD(+) synthetase n=1 Tax=Phenylobacterium parvum TaxID=2201350 RepID=A0A2Z3HW91_9CAUL|nr:NAD+ synthase [Phenylobacterium parvum]AWM77651.1 NAD+ synthase [Phenylobacterium parvum]